MPLFLQPCGPDSGLLSLILLVLALSAPPAFSPPAEFLFTTTYIYFNFTTYHHTNRVLMTSIITPTLSHALWYVTLSLHLPIPLPHHMMISCRKTAYLQALGRAGKGMTGDILPRASTNACRGPVVGAYNQVSDITILHISFEAQTLARRTH